MLMRKIVIAINEDNHMDNLQQLATSAPDLEAEREKAADRYGGSFITKSGFKAGWDAAMRVVGLALQTPGGDGCYCAHHPDNPAHTKDCYDLTKALAERF
jgi:hypothetical protein